MKLGSLESSGKSDAAGLERAEENKNLNKRRLPR
jgi:hypothetical protein